MQPRKAMLLNEPSRCAFKQRPSRWDELSVTSWEGVGMFGGGLCQVSPLTAEGVRMGREQRVEQIGFGKDPQRAPGPTPGVDLCPTWHQVHMQVWVCAPHGTGSNPRAGFVPQMALSLTLGKVLCLTWHQI